MAPPLAVSSIKIKYKDCFISYSAELVIRVTQAAIFSGNDTALELLWIMIKNGMLDSVAIVTE